PCKHIAAVYYLLAERFDEDPFLIFKLRGRTKEQIIQVLREKRAASQAEESASSSTEADTTAPDQLLTLEERLDTFWQAGEALDAFAVNPAAPGVDKAILKRLGAAPFTVRGQNITFLLSKAYGVIEDTAMKKATEGEG